jgi:hypothetical protein
VFELGLGTTYSDVPSNMSSMPSTYRPGASLRGWKEYFPKAHIYGADVDKRVLFEEERIQTTYCDQTKPEVIHEMWSTPGFSDPFDIIIEDGLHTFEANVCFLEHSLERARLFYVIEDVHQNDLPRFAKKIMAWYYQGRFRNYEFSFYESPSKTIRDDHMILIRRRDGVYNQEPMYASLMERWEDVKTLEHLMDKTIGEWRGCGSYMSDGQSARYPWSFFPKQQLFWQAIQDLSSKKSEEEKEEPLRLLEIGVHGGQSLLLALMANPKIHITAIDPCFWGHTRKCITHLQDTFTEAKIVLVPSKSEDVIDTRWWRMYRFDVMHIDGNHTYEGCLSDLEWALIGLPKTILFDDVDADGVRRAMDKYHIRLQGKSLFPYRNGVWHLPSPQVHFVTAFFSIDYYLGEETHLEKAEEMFQYTPNVMWHVYTDKAKLIQSWGFPNVEVIDTTLNKRFPYPLEDTLRLPPARHPQKDTAKYMQVQLTKLYLCQDLLEREASVESVAWIDFGIFKQKGAPKREMGALISRLSLLDVASTGKNYFPGFHVPVKPRDDIYEHIVWSFAGTFFIGGRASMQELMSHYDPMVRDMLGSGHITWEINLFHNIAAIHKKAITFYPCNNHKESMFYSLLKQF